MITAVLLMLYISAILYFNTNYPPTLAPNGKSTSKSEHAKNISLKNFGMIPP